MEIPLLVGEDASAEIPFDTINGLVQCLDALSSLTKTPEPERKLQGRSLMPETTSLLSKDELRCTYTKTGEDFKKQHWYNCHTCDLKWEKGCCSLCVKVCHAGHEVQYSRYSSFFCDCGAGQANGGALRCHCLQPQIFTGKATGTAQLSWKSVEAARAAREDLLSKISDKSWSVPLLRIFRATLSGLMEVLRHGEEELHVKNSSIATSKWWHDASGSQTTIQAYGHLFNPHRDTKAQSFDIKLQPEGTRGRQLKAFLQKHNIARSLLQSDSRGNLFLVERREVLILNPAQVLLSASSLGPSKRTFDRTSFACMARTTLSFDVVGLSLKFGSASLRF